MYINVVIKDILPHPIICLIYNYCWKELWFISCRCPFYSNNTPIYQQYYFQNMDICFSFYASIFSIYVEMRWLCCAFRTYVHFYCSLLFLINNKKIEINNLIFQLFTMSNYIFKLISNNLIFVVYLHTLYHITNNK